MFRAKYTSCYKSFETVLSRGPRPTPPIFNRSISSLSSLLLYSVRYIQYKANQINSILQENNRIMMPTTRTCEGTFVFASTSCRQQRNQYCIV